MGFVLQSLRMAWRWLRRMRTALYLLGLLGLETLLATVAPQAPNVPQTVEAWRAGTAGPGRFVSGIIDLLGGYDVYGSVVFLGLLLLLFTSLTACLVPRVRAWWRITRRSQPPRTRHLATQEHVAQLQTDRTPDQALAAARSLLAQRRWRLRSEEPEPDPQAAPQVAAEKGHVLREGASLVFHVSFYVLLIAVVLGQLLGFTGQVGIVEGEPGTTETAIGYWRYEPGRWWSDGDHRGFTMDLDEFEVDWVRDPRFGGTPTTFLSTVTVTRPDGSSFQTTIGGNDPAVIDGMKVHQLDWGYAPRVVIREDGDVVHDDFLYLTATEEGFWRGAAKAPAADPDVGLELFLFPYAPNDEVTGQPQLTGAPWADAPLLALQSYTGDLRLSASQDVNTLDLTGMVESDPGALRPGSTYALADGVTVEFPELRRWVGFQVSHRPTVPLLLLGSVLLLLGLVPALYAYRRRVWVAATTDRGTGRTLVTVAGRAFQRPQAFEVEHGQLVKALQRSLDSAPHQPGEPPAAPHSSTPDPTTQAVPR